LRHGKWSAVREQHSRPECQELVDNATGNGELLKLLPNHRLPVHQHLQRQLDRERQQAPTTGLRDEELAKASDPEPSSSLLSEPNYHKVVSVSDDSRESIEGQWDALFMIL